MQQALERQIVFEDHKEAYALLGDRDEFLQVLRENFDCQFISRGEQLEILGEAAEVKMAATLVEELQYLYRQGTTITMHEVRYGIGLVRGGKGEALHTLFGDTILVTSRGRHVRPKTLGQRLYLDTIRHNSITFGIGSALAAVAGVLVGIYYNSIDPLMGIMPGLKAFVAAVLGGIGILPGAVVGGLILGVVEAFVSGFISSTFRDAAAFAILILVLLVRPAGIFGKNTKEKV